ncbi:MAG: hypothetical protein RQ801_02635, partial [Spirochaetaceae bacterium]|nr:hypothetical protein [Spirochaetaceae bacterium]
MNTTTRYLTTLLLLIAGVLPAAADDLVLWVTADIQGYLVGCDCPSGDSAGLSALAVEFEERDRENEPLIDVGGFYEPDRSDNLLEGYMDIAAGMLDYSAMTAVYGDLRDGPGVLKKRSKNLPVGVASGASDHSMLSRLPGERESLLITSGGTEAAVFSWLGQMERTRLAALGGRINAAPAQSFIQRVVDSDAAYRIIAVRGSEDDWRTLIALDPRLAALADLVVFTGEDSPGALLEGGGTAGVLESGGNRIPWFSLAPRGNGLAKVRLNRGRDAGVEIRTLTRGEAPESSAVLELGEAYMDDLVARALAAAGKDVPSSAELGGEPLEVTYWYPYGCRDCEDFLWNDVPEMERRTGTRVEIRERNTGEPGDFEALVDELDGLGVPMRVLPVMIVGDEVFQGDQEIKEGLEASMSGEMPAEHPRERAAVRWEPGAVFLAGLLDGVNPCAFSAMVFLVSALAVAGRSRRTMLAVGLFYALGIFITYSLVGAGLLSGIRRIAVSTGLRVWLEIILGVFLSLLALFSVIDGVRLSRGRTDLLLKLPQNLSGRVHGIIRSSVRSGAAAGGSFVLGAVVALIELGCTGQVYLPTIVYVLSRPDLAA